MALAYTAPTWVNGSGTGISASQLQALSDCMEGLVQGSDKAITNIAISGQTITLTFADGSVETKTASGLKGISSIAKTGTSGLVDTYTITYTDGSTSTFTVTNGTVGSFYTVSASIKSTDDPYGNIEHYIVGDFYKNGVLYNQSAFYKVTLVDETEYPPSQYLIDGNSGTFTNGHYSTGSIGGIPSGATITTQIYTDSTMTTLLAMVKVIIGEKGADGEQGQQGPAGADGADGVSPEVTITTITGGHRVNITDADHPSGQNFDVMDGQDGASDWSEITNKPNFATVATSGSYNDLSNKPTIPSTDNCYQSTDTAETALADGDYFPFYDTSATAKRKTLWSNIKSVLSNLFANKTDIAPVENSTTASQAYSIGQQFYYNGSLYKAKAAIAQGATFTVGTNCELAGSVTEQIRPEFHYSSTGFTFSGCEYSAGGYTKIGKLVIVNMRVKVTSADGNLITGFPAYGTRTTDNKMTVPMISANAGSTLYFISYDGSMHIMNHPASLVGNETAFSGCYICD